MLKFLLTPLICLSLTAQSDTIVDKAAKAGKFTTLISAAKAAGLADALSSQGPFTILAPTDEAFSKLPKETVSSLLKEENKDQLAAVLKYHIIEGKFTARQVAQLTSATMLNGDDITIDIINGQLTVNKINIIGTDIVADNGIIHVIDQVLIPPTKSPEKEILTYIAQSIKKGVPLFNNGQQKACGDVYETAVIGLLKFADSLSTTQKSILRKAQQKAAKEHQTTRAWTLRKALDQVYKSTEMKMEVSMSQQEDFDIILEADLPKGFPSPGPVNKIALKSFPLYRAAKVDGSSRNFSFMRLFGHIKQNNIAMTAPVEMKLDGQSGQREDMAFLYGNTSIGKVGTTNNGITVVDLPPQEYISFGMRGTESEELIKSAIDKLENWLVNHPTYQATGKPRLLGYNSPMIPAQKRYWEVQIPINKITSREF